MTVGPLLEQLVPAPIHDLALRALLDSALAHFYAFTLVLVRLSGMMVVGPVLGQSLVPANARIFVIVATAMLITPTIGERGPILFDRLDENRDGLLTRDEVPERLLDHYDRLLGAERKPPQSGLARHEFRFALPQPRTLLDYAWIGAGEFGIGLALGLGVLTILSGLQLAGDVIDQQTGLSLGEIANPGLDVTGSVTGHFLFTFATTVLLVMQPSGYHLTMISALVETFRTIPLGDALVTSGAVDLLRDLVHQSLVLGVQVAAPILASMSLVGLTMGFLGHTVPQINILVLGFPVRAVISLMVLVASLSGVARLVVDLVPTVIDSLGHALSAG